VKVIIDRSGGPRPAHSVHQKVSVCYTYQSAAKRATCTKAIYGTLSFCYCSSSIRKSGCIPYSSVPVFCLPSWQ